MGLKRLLLETELDFLFRLTPIKMKQYTWRVQVSETTIQSEFLVTGFMQHPCLFVCFPSSIFPIHDCR